MSDLCKHWISTPSMEPQLFSCGLPENKDNEDLVYLPSMEPQLFSCGLYLSISIHGIRIILQWSRNFSVADCQWTGIHPILASFPSMEPQLFSCGLLLECLASCLAHEPSMEPQLFSCGLKVCEAAHVILPSILQWSRNFSVADCRTFHMIWSLILYSFNGAATFQLRIADWRPCWWCFPFDPSMEPQLFSCGLRNAYEVQREREAPSMEPQLFSCGLQIDALADGAFHSTLQWSRNFSVADCGTRMKCKEKEKPLQWSRNFSVADCTSKAENGENM